MIINKNDDFFKFNVDFDFDNANELLNSTIDNKSIKKSDETEKLEKARIDTKNYLIDNYRKTDKKLLETLADTIDLLKNREKQKSIFKLYFFIIIMIVFTVLCLSPFFMLFFFRDIITNQSLVVTIIGTLTEILTAIIVLPKIIANYLFNLKEDEAYFKLISELKRYHEEKSKYIDSNK